MSIKLTFSYQVGTIGGVCTGILETIRDGKISKWGKF